MDNTPNAVLQSEREIATHVISVDDDSSHNPWTFRAFFLGLGLSAFGGSLGMVISCRVVSFVYFMEQLRYITSNRCTTSISAWSLSYVSSFLANRHRISDVHCHRLLHSRVCYGNFHPSSRSILLSKSCAPQSTLHYIYLTLLQHPFNKKENTFIIIMASAAANSALATEVLAVQRLYYNITPNAAASIFLLFSSQLLGYGIGGVLRREFALVE